MAIEANTPNDWGMRGATNTTLPQFQGVPRQLVVNIDDGYRPIIMDGSTLGGKFKCASSDELTSGLATKLGKSEKAESAKAADSVLWSNIQNVPNNVSNAVSYTSQTLTDEQKEQACNNLGLSAVASSGNYSDLSGKPAAHVTKSWRSGTEWYRVWSDGTIEQGGRKDLAGEPRLVTLHLPMSNSSYLAFVSPRTNTTSWPVSWSYNGSCTTTAVWLDGTGAVVAAADRNIVVDWRVEGN